MPDSVKSFFHRYHLTQETTLLILGGITGILGGFGAVIFHHTIELIHSLLFKTPTQLFSSNTFLISQGALKVIVLALIPSFGGLLVGLLAYFFEKGRKGEGIPSVIDAVSTKGGFIKGRVAILKILQSAISIGTGGAGGKEGPIVQIGAAIGSKFGQILSLKNDQLKILVGCGAAAGLSAAFNAPLGGALFTMEIILRSFNVRSFSPVVIASVFATVISRAFIGDAPAFQVPKYTISSNTEYIFYILLGIIAGLASVYFVKVFLKIDEIFDNLKSVPSYLKPAIGGLFVGLIGLYLPGVYGFSYSLIDSSLYNQTPFLLLVLLLIFKPIATGFTVGSGGNGGTFAPSIFTGAMVGGAFGQIINYLFPTIAAPPGAYALVGMGAVVAGTTHASLTALIMIFELTNNYKIILPLMLAIIISNLVSRRILKGSLYTLKFNKEGRPMDIYGRKISILKKMPIRHYNEIFEDIIEPSANFHSVIQKLQMSRFDTLIVCNEKNEMLGQIQIHDLRIAILDEETKSIINFIIAGDLIKPIKRKILIEETGEEALKIMEKYGLDFLPIIKSTGSELIGIVSKQRLLKEYERELFILENEFDLKIQS